METSALLKQQIAKEIGLSQKHVESVIRLLEDGNTVPFIARYRKEQTGSMDEVQIQTISERWQYIQNLNQRKEEVIRLIAEQDKLTDDLKGKIEQSVKLQEVEDLYRPYKQKRKTKATVAKSKGLEPLADYILTLPQDDRLQQLQTNTSAKKKKCSHEKKRLKAPSTLLRNKSQTSRPSESGFARKPSKEEPLSPQPESRQTPMRKMCMKCITSMKSQLQKLFRIGCWQ